MIEHSRVKAQDPIVLAFLADVYARTDWSDPQTRANWYESYRQEARGGASWKRHADWSGVNIHLALYWYHHIHKPGSREWRPVAVITAVIDAAIAWSKKREAANA